MNHLTEQEAAERWCPFARAVNVAVGETVAFNRSFTGWSQYDDNPRTCRCIGIRCMAWRWLPDTPLADRRGYCGLATGR